MKLSMFDYNGHKITVRPSQDLPVSVFDLRSPRDAALFQTTSLDEAMRWIDARVPSFRLGDRVNADGDVRNTGTVIESETKRGVFVRWHKGYAAWIVPQRLSLAVDVSKAESSAHGSPRNA